MHKQRLLPQHGQCTKPRRTSMPERWGVYFSEYVAILQV